MHLLIKHIRSPDAAFNYTHAGRFTVTEYCGIVTGEAILGANM